MKTYVEGTLFQPKSTYVFLISPWKHVLSVLIEVPQQGASTECPQHMFLWRNKKIKCYEDSPSYLELCIELKMLGIAGPPAPVAQLDAPSDWRPGGRGFNPRRGRQHSFVEIDHEMFSTVILSLPLIQEGQLSVSGERMCTILVNRLED